MADNAMTIDNLQIRISATAKDATASLDSLAKALGRVRDKLDGTNKKGVTATDALTQSLNRMNGALNTITTGGIRKLQKLANALNAYADACKRIKGNGAGVTKSISAVAHGIGTDKIVDSSAKSPGGSMDVDGSPESLGGKKGGLAQMGVFSAVAEREEKLKALKEMHVFANKASSATNKLGEETEKAGKKAQKAAGLFGKFVKSIFRIALYRAIRSALKAVGEAFSEGLKNAYQYSKQSESFQRLAETLDHLKSVTAQMVNQLGAFWGEFKQFIQPAITWLIEKIRSVSEGLTELFAALNGEKTYLQAQYVAQEWEEAADAAGKYKHQLLGIDELNNLSDNSKSGKDQVDYSKLYKEVSVSEGLLKIGEQWDALKKKITDSLTEIELALGGFMVGVGAALLFSGANIPLGLGLIVAGGFMAAKAITEKWDELKGELSTAIGAIEIMLGGFAFGIGAVLAFSGANIPLGIGLMLGGALTLANGVKTLNWNKMNKKTKQKISRLTTIVSGASLALGAILAFSGVNLPVGIALMAAGAIGLASEIALNWDDVRSSVDSALKEFEPFFLAAGLGSMALGLLLLFTGNLPLGIGLLVGGGFLVASEIAVNWDSILKNLKDAWEDIRAWWNTSVKPKITSAIEWAEEKTGLDINGDGVIGKGITVKTKQPQVDVPEMPSMQIPEVREYMDVPQITVPSTLINMPSEVTVTDPKVLEDLENGESLSAKGKFVKMIWDGVTSLFSKKKAIGGIPQPGTLFFAGEAGPEFVGSIGNSSAVANTSQMTDAIYKAAYMGMSRALAENGDNGLSGFVPASTDDLFIAMRKKASNYNKVTGNSAFA